MKEIKQHLLSMLQKAFSALEKIQSKITITLALSTIMSLATVAINYSNGQSFYVVLIGIVPMVLLGIYWAFIGGLLSVKDSVDEISEYISELTEFKDSSIINKEKPSMLQVMKVLNSLNGLKEAPSMVLEGMSAMKKIAAVFNPVSLIVIVVSGLFLWVYSIYLLLAIVF